MISGKWIFAKKSTTPVSYTHLFQDAGASLCPIRTIGEQIYESMCAHTKITRSEAKSRAMDLFDKLNFKDSQRVWDSYPFELSGHIVRRCVFLAYIDEVVAV